MGAGAADTVALSLRVQSWAVVASTECPVFVMSFFGCGDIWCSVAMTPEDTGTGTGAAAESSGGEKGGRWQEGEGEEQGAEEQRGEEQWQQGHQRRGETGGGLTRATRVTGWIQGGWDVVVSGHCGAQICGVSAVQVRMWSGLMMAVGTGGLLIAIHLHSPR
jgi:hypothetical protein